MNTDNTVKQRASLFDLDGVPKMSQAIPLALQLSLIHISEPTRH